MRPVVRRAFAAFASTIVLCSADHSSSRVPSARSVRLHMVHVESGSGFRFGSQIYVKVLVDAESSTYYSSVNASGRGDSGATPAWATGLRFALAFLIRGGAGVLVVVCWRLAYSFFWVRTRSYSRVQRFSRPAVSMSPAALAPGKRVASCARALPRDPCAPPRSA